MFCFQYTVLYVRVCLLENKFQPDLNSRMYMYVYDLYFSQQEHRPSWASYQIRKIAGCACAGNAGNVFPRRRFQRKPLVSDPGMHHGTCVTHVPWCMSGSLTCGDGENVPGIPGACAPAILRIWQEAHGNPFVLQVNRDPITRRASQGWQSQPRIQTVTVLMHARIKFIGKRCRMIIESPYMPFWWIKDISRG